jgi:hypothetical protein
MFYGTLCKFECEVILFYKMDRNGLKGRKNMEIRLPMVDGYADDPKVEVEVIIDPILETSGIGGKPRKRAIYRGVDLGSVGYGDAGTVNGHGRWGYLEYYQGRLQLLIWADINKEDPTHIIDLEGARESNRKE